VPLASGLLTGKLSATSRFAHDDHRSFNRRGEAFDKGETFSGVPYDVGLSAVEELRALAPPRFYAHAKDTTTVPTLAQLALRWTLMFDAVTCAIPGARTPDQARSNAAAADLPALDPATMDAVQRIYDQRIRPHVHSSW
jgi:aryl-alcohol dehydrogenase-like predicted oxidoreductase